MDINLRKIKVDNYKIYKNIFILILKLNIIKSIIEKFKKYFN